MSSCTLSATAFLRRGAVPLRRSLCSAGPSRGSCEWDVVNVINWCCMVHLGDKVCGVRRFRRLGRRRRVLYDKALVTDRWGGLADLISFRYLQSESAWEFSGLHIFMQ